VSVVWVHRDWARTGRMLDWTSWVGVDQTVNMHLIRIKQSPVSTSHKCRKASEWNLAGGGCRARLNSRFLLFDLAGDRQNRPKRQSPVIALLSLYMGQTSDLWPEAIYNLRSGKWLAWANNILQYFVAIRCSPRARGGDYRGDGGTRPPKKFWLGGRKCKHPPNNCHF